MLEKGCRTEFHTGTLAERVKSYDREGTCHFVTFLSNGGWVESCPTNNGGDVETSDASNAPRVFVSWFRWVSSSPVVQVTRISTSAQRDLCKDNVDQLHSASTERCSPGLCRGFYSLTTGQNITIKRPKQQRKEYLLWIWVKKEKKMKKKKGKRNA